MTRRFVLFLPSMLLILFAGCSESEKPTEPSIISEDQLVNPRDTSYTADSLALPPPAVWVESIVEGLRIRFNGQFSETTPDSISGVIDFEGYRIWLARDNVREQYSLIMAYDLHDYNKWVWVQDSARYMLLDIPYSLDSLRCLHGDEPDPCLDSRFFPDDYTRVNPYVHPDSPDSFFWFEPHSYNLSDMGAYWQLRKVYPDEPDPATLPIGSLTLDRFTDDGYFKYYEYEYTIEGLYPRMLFWINVSVFDFGYAPLGIEPSETDHWSGAIGAYPRIR